MPAPEAAETTATTTPDRPSYLLSIPMKHLVIRDEIVLRRDFSKPDNAHTQFEEAVAAIVERAVAKDRAARGEVPADTMAKQAPTVEEARERKVCRICLKPFDVTTEGRYADAISGREHAHQECLDTQRAKAALKDQIRDLNDQIRQAVAENRSAREPASAPASKDGLETCPMCKGGPGCDRCPRCHGSAIVFTAEELPAKRKRSTMPAFPMRKEVTPDRVTLVREPCEKGSAFEQFEATLKAYLERHPVYRERVVERDRPCPICAAEADDDEDLDEDEWGEDDDGGDEVDDWDGEEHDDAPSLPSAPSGFSATLRQALAEETADPRDVREIAAALVRQMKNGNVDAIRFVAGGSGQ